MKLRIAGLLAVAAVVGMAASMPSLAQDKKYEGVTLTINGYGGVYDEIVKRTVADPLKNEHGLEVVFQPAGSTAATAQILASPNNPPYDVLMADSPSIPALMEAGVLEPIATGDIPNASKLLPGLREFGDYCFPFSIASIALVYNTEQISTPPKSYADLANKEYEGKVGLISLQSSGGVLFLAALAESNGGGVGDMDPGFKALQAIKPNVLAAFDATVPQLQAFQNGEATIGVFWNGRIHELQTKGAPVQLVVPEEGIYSVLSYVCPIKGSKNAEAVRDYIDHALSDEAISALAEHFTYGPTTTAKISEEIAPKVITYGEEGIAKVKQLDWKTIAEKRGEWTDRWNREMR